MLFPSKFFSSLLSTLLLIAALFPHAHVHEESSFFDSTGSAVFELSDEHAADCLLCSFRLNLPELLAPSFDDVSILLPEFENVGFLEEPLFLQNSFLNYALARAPPLSCFLQ